MLRMVRQPGIVDLLYFLVLVEEGSDRASVAVMLLHAHGKGLDAAQHQPALKRRQDRSR